MINAVNWLEIPVKDYNRAKKFYSAILDAEVTDHPMPTPDVQYGILPYDREKNGVGGALIQAEGQNPTTEGMTLYLPGGDDLATPLSRVEAAGGRIIQPKTNIGENGFMAQFIDTEGNRLALHSMN